MRGSVGRIASCASWAFLALVLYSRMNGATYFCELASDDAADGVDRFRHDRDAVGSHVGDEADRLAADVDAFIEALGDLHRLLGREAELARGVHLQRRGRERRDKGCASRPSSPPT